MVKLSKLQKFMEEKLGYSLDELLTIDIDELDLVEKSSQALYKLYQRFIDNQKDLISMMDTNHLIAMSEGREKRNKNEEQI